MHQNESESLNESALLDILKTVVAYSIIIPGIPIMLATEAIKDKIKDINKEEIKYLTDDEASKSYELLDKEDLNLLKKEIEEANSILKSVYKSKVKKYDKYLELGSVSGEHVYTLNTRRKESNCYYIYCGIGIYMDMRVSRGDDNIDDLFDEVLKTINSIVKEANEKIEKKKFNFNISVDFESSGWDGIATITSKTKLKPKKREERKKQNESFLNDLF